MTTAPATPAPEPSEAETLARLLSHIRELYRDPLMQLTWDEIEPRWREIYLDDASTLLASTWLAERDQRMQDKGAWEALAEVEAECTQYANYCVSPSYRSGVDHAVEIIVAHRKRFGGDDA